MESSTDSKRTNLLSAEYSGGDFDILPAKKKKDKKKIPQGPKKPKLSKSQKRKLKKLEEEKEKEVLLKESMDTLEKYKIKDDVYSLMWSSRNLGQVETVREKRLREVRYAQAGLELPEFERRVKKRTDVANQNIVELRDDDGHGHLQSSATADAVMHEIPVSIVENIICDNEHLIPDGDGDFSIKEDIQPVAELPKESSTLYSHDEEIVHSIKKVDVDSDSGYTSGENNKNCSSIGNFTTPTVVHVTRSEEIQKQREGLPIIMMEQEIMEAINQNISIILCGATGCGKTTQVPQFLYEAGYGSNSGIIGVTQPRRVAVFATAKRVAKELGFRQGKEVGYQVRHDKKVGKNCSIKFMTDGILLREVQSDFLLRRYSVIILDEAHERSLNTDILIGMLSRVIQERHREYEEQQKRILSGETIDPASRIYPLKLILMSATLRVEDFLSGGRIFRSPPPVIEVPARQYPVTVHFSKRTEIVDYVGQAYKKVMSIHKRLPPGGILVFVTGQREVEYLCKKLRKASLDIVKREADKGKNEASPLPDENLIEENDLEETNEPDHDIIDRFSMKEDQFDFSENESETSYDSEEEESDLEYYNDNENESKSARVEPEDVDMDVTSLKSAFEALTGNNTSVDSQGDSESNKSSSVMVKKEKDVSVGPMRVLPLYTMLPEKDQRRVFEETKNGRLVVVSTNVAETSLTIPGIAYVVDSGREKVKNYNSSNGMEKFEVQWISKASAAQRTGRAGRTGPGHCYRLYSSAVFTNIFPDFSVAEILKVPVDWVVLLLKSMNIGKAANFPFPTPPDTKALVEAEHCLKVLEALDEKGRLTPLGKAMARFPMTPRHSRMLLTVIQIMQKAKSYDRANLVLGFAVAAAAALSLPNPFVIQYEGNNSEEQSDSSKSEKVKAKEEKLKKKQLKQNARTSREKFLNPTSDALTIAFALQCFELSELSKSGSQFCSDNALHYKTMTDMSNMRAQLLRMVFSSASNTQQDFSWNHGNLEIVECAWKVQSNKNPLLSNEEEILGQAICAGWADRVAKRIKGPQILAEGERRVNSARYEACAVKETVFLHRLSSVSRSPPEFLVYSELLHTRRPYINGATSVKPSWLVQYAKSSCTFSAPLQDPKPYYDPTSDQVFSWVAPTFGPHLWPLPLHGMPIEDNFTRVAVFACSLLEGNVLPCLKHEQEFLATTPASMLKPEGLGLKRVGNLLGKLNRKGRVIDNCAKLGSLWKEDKMALFQEIQDWFQKAYHSEFEKLWEIMLSEVELDPKQRFPKKASKGKKKNVEVDRKERFPRKASKGKKKI